VSNPRRLKVAGCSAKLTARKDSSRRLRTEGSRAMAEEKVGIVSDYFAHVSVAGIELSGVLRVGDRIHIKGHTTDLEQVVESMQIEHNQVEEGKSGDAIGIKVGDRCRHGDEVFKVT
jgi:translation elongation factor EF-Tu-like GTPase